MTQEQNDQPLVSDKELKMPEAPFGKNARVGASLLGPLLFFLITVLVLLLGGLYLWGTLIQNEIPEPIPTPRPTAAENNEPESTNAEAEVETLEAVSTSDEITAIEADIEATNLDNLDAELNAIDAELNAALE